MTGFGQIHLKSWYGDSGKLRIYLIGTKNGGAKAFWLWSILCIIDSNCHLCFALVFVEEKENQCQCLNYCYLGHSKCRDDSNTGLTSVTTVSRKDYKDDNADVDQGAKGLAK